MNIIRDWESLHTKFCSVCVFLIVTPSKLFKLVFDPFSLLRDNLNGQFKLQTKKTKTKFPK